MRVFSDLTEFKSAIGDHLGYSDWLEVTQDRVNLFADATEDHQWIHVDPERAKEGPYEGTIAHGYLTLSLLPYLMHQIFRIEGLRMGVNYGLDRVRFPSPIKVGARVRAGAELLDVKNTPAGKLSKARITIEVEGTERPACIAETLSLYVR